MRKICVITGSRAEYGLLYQTMKKIKADEDLILQVCVTGMHLSPEFGLTYKKIEEDGFHIDEKVEMLLSSDTAVGITKSIGLGVIGFADAIERLKPDVVLVLGDRFEILAAVTACLIAKIPVAHCHGGETTEGAYDESIRHAITKMSHIHFTSTEVYRKRVIQLGENPENVYNVGALGIENCKKLPLLSKKNLEKSLNFSFGELTFLVTFHPTTLENSSSKEQFRALLSSLNKFSSAKIIFTKANADNDGRIINQLIDEYVSENPERSIAFTSMGQIRYLTALKYTKVVIGNSSSGIIEAPSFGIPTLNIGDRQKGRIFAKSVLHCEPKENKIEHGIQKCLEMKIDDIDNPYDKENTSSSIIGKIKSINIESLLKKQFYDYHIDLVE